MLRAFSLLAGAIVLVALLGGCGGSPTVHPGITISLDASLRDPVTSLYPPIRARVAGATMESVARWRAEDVTKHFTLSKGEATDAGAVELGFESGKARIPADHPAWAQWNRPAYLVVMVDIPGKGAEGGKPDDPRRRVISLNKKRWAKLEGDLLIAVTQAGVTVVSPETPVEPGEF